MHLHIHTSAHSITHTYYKLKEKYEESGDKRTNCTNYFIKLKWILWHATCFFGDHIRLSKDTFLFFYSLFFKWTYFICLTYFLHLLFTSSIQHFFTFSNLKFKTIFWALAIIGWQKMVVSSLKPICLNSFNKKL